MSEPRRIPQEAIDEARGFDLGALAARYGFAGRASSTGEAVGPCPGCGGTDRFSVNARRNIWRCRQGGGDPIGGDAVAMVQHFENCSFPKAVEILIGDLSQIVPRAAPEKPRDDNEFREKERRRAFSLWREGKAFSDDGAVAAYLAGRGIDPAYARMRGATCREHADMPFWQPYQDGPALPGRKTKIRYRIVHRGPAMLWPIVAPDGHFLGLHVTWLEPAGPKGKAEIFCPDTGEQLPAKKVRGSLKGGRIVLRQSDSGDEAAGEGVESVLSWFAMHDRDVTLSSAVTLGNLTGRATRTVAHPTEKTTRRDGAKIPVRVPGPDPRADDDPALLFAPRPDTARLTLIADGDSDPFTTRAAMLRGEARLARPGLSIDTDWPPTGHDFNSLHLSQRLFS